MLNLTAVFNVQINIALHGAIHSAAVYIGKRQGGINLHMSAAGDILVQTSANHIAAGCATCFTVNNGVCGIIAVLHARGDDQRITIGNKGIGTIISAKRLIRIVAVKFDVINGQWASQTNVEVSIRCGAILKQEFRVFVPASKGSLYSGGSPGIYRYLS